MRMRRETVTVAAQVFNEHSYWSDTEYWFWTTQTYIHVWTNYLFSGVRRVLRISKQQHNADYKRRIYKCMPSSPSCVCNLDPSSSVTWNVSNCFLTCKNGKINETQSKLEPIWTRGWDIFSPLYSKIQSLHRTSSVIFGHLTFILALHRKCDNVSSKELSEIKHMLRVRFQLFVIQILYLHFI